MSIQDDIFDMGDFFKTYTKETGDEEPEKTWKRLYNWAVSCENEAYKLSPIVGKMREAISLMFEKDE